MKQKIKRYYHPKNDIANNDTVTIEKFENLVKELKDNKVTHIDFEEGYLEYHYMEEESDEEYEERLVKEKDYKDWKIKQDLKKLKELKEKYEEI